MLKNRLNILNVLAGLFACLLTLTACDDERTIGYDELPSAARTFIERYFPARTVHHVQREKDDGRRKYECTLDDGTQLEFDASGEWTEVDCKFSALPEGILPGRVAEHLAEFYPQAVAYKVERQLGGYEVSVSGSLELIYLSLIHI